MEQSQSNIDKTSFRMGKKEKKKKQKKGKLPNGTDIMEQSQSNIDNKSFRTRKKEKKKKQNIPAAAASSSLVTASVGMHDVFGFSRNHCVC